MDYKTLKINVRNAFDQLFLISCQNKLGHLLDMTYENYFLIDIKSAYDTVFVMLSLHFFLNHTTRLILLPIDTSIETVCKNKIGVFRDTSIMKQIFDLGWSIHQSESLRALFRYPRNGG